MNATDRAEYNVAGCSALFFARFAIGSMRKVESIALMGSRSTQEPKTYGKEVQLAYMKCVGPTVALPMEWSGAARATSMGGGVSGSEVTCADVSAYGVKRWCEAACVWAEGVGGVVAASLSDERRNARPHTCNC